MRHPKPGRALWGALLSDLRDPRTKISETIIMGQAGLGNSEAWGGRDNNILQRDVKTGEQMDQEGIP